MNSVFHQWRWDFRRVRLAWILWLALLVLTTALRHLALTGASRHSPLLPLSGLVEAVVIHVFGTLLVIFAVFTTPFAGSSAFWKTRPLPTRSLFWEKTLFIIVMVWLPAVASRAIQYLLIDPDPSLLSGVFLTYVPLTIGIYFLAAVLAALSVDLHRLILSLAGALGLVVILGMLAAAVHRGTAEPLIHIGNPGTVSTWQTLVTSLVLMALIVLAAWFLGGLLRRRRAATVTAALALAVLASQNSLWSVSLGKGQLRRATTVDFVVLDRDQEPEPPLSPPYPQLAAILPDDQILVPVELESRFIRGRDQRSIHAAIHSSGSTAPARQLRHLYPAGTRFISSESHTSVNLINDRDVGRDPGTFTGSCSGVIFRYRRLGSLPATPGAAKKFRGYGIVRVGTPDPGHDEFELPVSSVSRNRNFDRRRYLRHTAQGNLAAILRHARTGTLVAPAFGGSNSNNGFILAIQTEELRFTNQALHAALGRPASIGDLAEFELDLYALTPVAEAAGTFRKEGWIPFTDRAADPGQPGPPDDAWTRAELVEDPTPAQVDAYLDTIMGGLPGTLSGAQQRTLESKFDALGATHLDHLIARLPVSHYIRHVAHNTIRGNATRKHLPALLAAFRRDPAVAGILLQKRWQDDAVGLARDHLRSHGPFSVNDTIALVTIATTIPAPPSLNDDLFRHFVLGGGGHSSMIPGLREQPGFRLQDAMAGAWSRERAGLSPQTSDLAFHVIRLGDREALRRALARLTTITNPDHRSHAQKRALLDAGVDQPPGEDPLRWAYSHFDRLQFDPERKVFALPD